MPKKTKSTKTKKKFKKPKKGKQKSQTSKSTAREKIKTKIKSYLKNPKFIILTITSLILIFLFSFFILRDLPSPTTLNKDIFPISTKILDRNGKLLYEIYADQNRTPIKIDNIPDSLIQATVAIEDKNFFSHYGFDTQGIIRAAFKTISGQGLEGGSTITQQLVKVALLSPERTIERKLKEVFLSLATEILYTKSQILEMYLNHIPYGGTAYGIEAAAQLYFNKSSYDLSLSEASMLAGLPQAPTRYSPFSNPDATRARQSQVLSRMVEEKFITQEEADNAKQQELEIAQPFTNIEAPHFVMYIREQLENTYGLQKVEQGGLIVTTTLDLDLQQAAQASLSAEIESLARLRVSNGASIITNPQTGEILAMIGSRDYFDDEIDGRVNVTTRLRQPGSSIKPLNYALALETKIITPSTMILDTPICFLVQGQPDYCPRNYDNTIHRAVQIRYALGNSYNIPAVKILALNDIPNFIQFARKMGISTWEDPSRYGLSLTLGGGEVKMIDMAEAFGVFANKGTRVPLVGILKVETHRGDILEQYNQLETKASVLSMASLTPLDCTTEKEKCPLDKPLSPQTAFLISDILSDNNARSAAFGSFSVLNIPGKIVSVKTGTTNDLRDNWTVGYTSEYLVVTWVGNNDNTSMSYIASGITGASPIWQDIMKYILKGVETPPLEPPEGIVRASVCTDSGTIPVQDSTCSTRLEYFFENTIPTVSRITKKEIWINLDTQRPPQSEEEFNNIELQEHLIASDPFLLEYCLDCALPNIEGNENNPAPEEGITQNQITEQPIRVIYSPGAFIFNEE